MTEENIDIPDHVVAREVSGEMVIMNLESGTYFTLDPVGARIWELLEQRQSPSSICDTIQSEYDAVRETVEADLAELLTKLAKRELIVRPG